MNPSTLPTDRAHRANERRNPAVFVTVLATVALAAAMLAAAWPGAVGAQFWFWLAACAVGEAMWLRLPVGNATLSMGSCFNLAALLVLPLGEALLATGAASLVVELVVMRKPPIRGLFNASHTMLAVGAGSVVFTAAAGGSRDLVALIARMDLVPFIAAAFAYYAVNRAAVTLIVALHDRATMLAVWRSNFGNAYEYLASGAVFSLGALLAVHYVGIGMAGTLLVLLPLLLAFDGYRRHLRLAERRAEAEAHQDRKAA